MRGSAVQFWLILACVLAAIYGSSVAWRNAREQHVEVARVENGHAKSESANPGKLSGEPLKEFTLTDENGKPFDSKSLDGKVWVGSFFFVNCPGTCWKLNRALADIQQQTPGSDVRYVSITCDPDNDTPEALAKYAEHFHADPARWTFLTGDFRVIQGIGRFFQVAVERETHSDRAFVIDRRGVVRGRFRLTDPEQIDMLKKLIAVVEAEQPAPQEPLAPQEPTTPQENAAEPASPPATETKEPSPKENESPSA